MRMLRIFLMGGCLFLTLLPTAPAGAAKEDPSSRWPNARERGSYQAKIASTGEILWWVNWETTVGETAGGKRVEIVEEGKGRPWKYPELITWKKRMVFEASPSAVIVESVRGKRWTQEGEFLSEIEIERDATGTEMVYRDSLPGEPMESATLKWTPQILPDELLFHWARMILFAEPGEAKCLLWISPKRRFRMTAQVQGTETVTTPAGTFSCYRVGLRPELFAP